MLSQGSSRFGRRQSEKDRYPRRVCSATAVEQSNRGHDASVITRDEVAVVTVYQMARATAASTPTVVDISWRTDDNTGR
jgi:hypothetical protein